MKACSRSRSPAWTARQSATSASSVASGVVDHAGVSRGVVAVDDARTSRRRRAPDEAELEPHRARSASRRPTLVVRRSSPGGGRSRRRASACVQTLFDSQSSDGSDAPISRMRMRDARQDHAVAEGGEHLVPVRVLDGMARDLRVARERLLLARDAVEVRAAVALVVRPVEEAPPAEVGLRVAEERHLPVEHRGDAIVAEHHVRQARVAPAQAHAPRREGVGAQPGEAGVERGLRRSLVAHQREVALPVGELAIDRVARAIAGSPRKSSPSARQSSAWTRPSSRAPFHQMRARRVRRRVVDPAEDVVRRHLGRHLAVDRVHHVEGAAEHRGIALEPAHRRHRDAAAGEARHHLVLPLEVVLGKDQEVARLEPRDEALVLRRAAPAGSRRRRGTSRSRRPPSARGATTPRGRVAAGSRRRSQSASARADLIEVALAAEHARLSAARRAAPSPPRRRPACPGRAAAPMPKKPWIMPS